eukprot:CAMPEP_0176411614 /NCGR_PEP_ID=MMETSP0127-20121128/3699_1 /TAXON_ID=938130 /ORGANISM="Platyophrya macrostoma, Strain WH" /LENGTH=536 /DNA_ID=CAMNT_0017791219 /DNA_START=387 /DNA_END=1997 /DNA_ORIENTATION=+
MYTGRMTSRTIKDTTMKMKDIETCIANQKFEEVNVSHPLPPNVHGCNVFSVFESKGRRRVITEPLLNNTFTVDDLPHLSYPSRFAKRKNLQHKKYLIQLDFCAFYDSIELPSCLRDFFVFRKHQKTFRLKTLPTGARFSVCFAQSITWAIVDVEIDATVVVHTMIDNIIIAGEEGKEKEFLSALKSILLRIKTCNLSTDPPQEFFNKSDKDLLLLASATNTFLGEDYVFNPSTRERETRNSVKCLAKLSLAIQRTEFSYRSMASLISLILFMMHTIHLSPSSAFFMLRLYRGISVRVSQEGGDWDKSMSYVCPAAMNEIKTVSNILLQNKTSPIPVVPMFSYDDDAYDIVLFTDASAGGWGAVRKDKGTLGNTIYQQKWTNILKGEVRKIERTKGNDDASPTYFTTHHSAHAEPWAIKTLLSYLLRTEPNIKHKRIAVITDHQAIVFSQKKDNLYGGIGKGFALNSLFMIANLFPSISFFYIAGENNPADVFSRTFDPDMREGQIKVSHSATTLPLLKNTYCPVVEQQICSPHFMK